MTDSTPSLWILVSAKLRVYYTYRYTDISSVGLMRLDECQQVKETLNQHLGINLTIVDGTDLFLGRLAGVKEPETKRKIIGETCESVRHTMNAHQKTTVRSLLIMLTFGSH